MWGLTQCILEFGLRVAILFLFEGNETPDVRSPSVGCHELSDDTSVLERAGVVLERDASQRSFAPVLGHEREIIAFVLQGLVIVLCGLFALFLETIDVG